VKTVWTLILSAFLLAGAALAASEPGKTAKGGDKAKALFEAKCSNCHPLSRSLTANKDKEGWAASVKRMRETNGCQLTDKEAKEIVEYLAKIRGPQKTKP
jgi:cytochrome c5